MLNKNEPEINFTYCGQTPFFYACNHGKVGVVKLLLRWPHPTELDVNQRSDGGETPFLAACRGDHLGVVKVLLETGPKASPLLEDLDPNQKANDGRSALWCAAHKGHVRTLKWLLENCGVGRLDWEAAADGLEGFDPPRKVTCLQAAKAMARGDDVLKIVKQGVSKQRRQRARDRMRRAQKATKASVRMRDADGVFFGTDIYDSSNLDDLNREKHDLGNQKGIDYGGRTAATDELNAKAAAAQGGGDNKALAMFGGGKKKSPFRVRYPGRKDYQCACELYRRIEEYITRLGPRPPTERRRAGDDLDELRRDARLARAVVDERELVDELAGVLRGVLHGLHAAGLLRRGALHHAVEDLRGEVVLAEAAEHVVVGVVGREGHVVSFQHEGRDRC